MGGGGESKMVEIAVGEKAPDFTLHDTELKPHTLGEFLGNKLVLAFFQAHLPLCVLRKCALSAILWQGSTS